MKKVIFGFVAVAMMMLVSCNKENGVKPELTEQENTNLTQNSEILAPNSEFQSFEEIQNMLSGKGSLKVKPSDYNSYLPISDKYHIWVFEESLTGKITEIYVFNHLSDARETSNNNFCDKVYTTDGQHVCCSGDGGQCRTIIDECGNVCIVLCLS